MANDTSKLTINNKTYDLKDATARSGLDNKVDKNGTDSLMTADEHTKLGDIAYGAEVNVQANWTQTTTTADDYIKNKPTLGTAAAKDVPSSGKDATASQVVMGNDTRLSDARTPKSHTHTKSDITDLSEPMVFKGSVGTNGTVTTLPTDGSATVGDTYKVITAGTYAGQVSKVGDTFICQTKTSSANTWVLIPSGDEPSGTVTSVATGTGLTGGTITSSGTISHADTSSQASVNNSGRTYIQSVTLDGMGHVTKLSSATETVTNTDRYVNSAAFASQGTNGADGSKMTLTRAGSDTATVTATIPVATTSAAGVMSGAMVTKLNGIAAGAEVNQNAFSNVVVGSTTVAADSKTDTLTLVAGDNVTLTPDAANDKITIAATDTTYSSKAAASGGTDVSLVTTGEKYNWNNKSNLTIGTTSTTAAAGDHNHDTVYTHKFHYGTTATQTTKIKVKINDTSAWMLSFVVNLYQGYRATSVLVSGYQYGNSHWYSPKAVILGDSNNAAINVYFGYDSVNNLWVGFDGGQYTGASISNVTNGYTQIDNFAGLFTISSVSSLATLQTTITAQPPSLNGHTHTKSQITDFPTIPTVNNGTFSVKTKVGSNTAVTAADFTANQSDPDDVTFIQGDNVTLTTDAPNRTIKIAAIDTTYSSKAAASGGTDVSLVTTGEKYTWNSKTSNTGTVTKVSTGIGLTGGDVTTTGTIKAKLRSETKLTNDSAAATETSGRVYPVAADKSGYLAVNVPWTDHMYTVNNGKLTIKGNSTEVSSMTANQSGNTTLVISEGANNGTIKISDGGTTNVQNVPVHGLGTAAYTASTAYATAAQGAKADSALQSHQTIKQDGVTGATVNRYGACATAAATAAKTVSVTSGTFSLEAGAVVNVKFTNANTASTPTLNVNSTGAKNIFVNGAQITTGGNKAMLKGTVSFIYDGTQYNLIGNYTDTDTHYTTHLYVGASNGNTNAATTNGNTNLIVCDNTTARDRRLLQGAGTVEVSSDANGNITIINNTTDGRDIADVFSGSIGSSNAWDWINTAIEDGTILPYLRPGDYLSLTTSDSKTFDMRIAGINTYQGDLSAKISDTWYVNDNHIDFISRQVYGKHKVNTVKFNNGIAASPESNQSPWLVSDMYYYLNSLSGKTPNQAVVGGGIYDSSGAIIAGGGNSVNYTSTGVFDKLPANIRNMIIEKMMYATTRFSASGVLNDNTTEAILSVGKLWLPTEFEVSGDSQISGHAVRYQHGMQYPLFMNRKERQFTDLSGASAIVATICPAAASKYWTYIDRYGSPAWTNADAASLSVPICFRLASLKVRSA